MSGGRVIGANDRINVGVIGCGGRGSYDAQAFDAFGKKHNNACQIVAACDVYEKRKKMVAEKYKVKGYLDYRELLNQSDVDAVVIATPGPLARQDGAWTPWTRARTSISKSPWSTPTKRPGSWWPR